MRSDGLSGRGLLHCLDRVFWAMWIKLWIVVVFFWVRLQGRQAPGMPTQQGWGGHRSCPFGHLPCGVIYWHWRTWAWKPRVCVFLLWWNMKGRCRSFNFIARPKTGQVWGEGYKMVQVRQNWDSKGPFFHWRDWSETFSGHFTGRVWASARGRLGHPTSLRDSALKDKAMAADSLRAVHWSALWHDIYVYIDIYIYIYIKCFRPNWFAS